MPYISARYIRMANDEGQITSDTYVYATDDLGKVHLTRVDAIEEKWVRFIAEGGVISPYEIPTVTGIDPVEAQVGDPDLTLTVTGTDFTENSQILWNGGLEPTEFVSPTELTTIVKPSTAWPGGAVVSVQVQTGTWKTTPVDFTFTPEEPPIEDEAEAGKTAGEGVKVTATRGGKTVAVDA